MNFPKTYRRNGNMGKHFDADALHVDTGTGYDCSGTVSIRTKNLFLTIQATHRPDNIRYAVKIRRFGAWYPPFLGNMMTVRLPLR